MYTGIHLLEACPKDECSKCDDRKTPSRENDTQELKNHPRGDLPDARHAIRAHGMLLHVESIYFAAWIVRRHNLRATPVHGASCNALSGITEFMRAKAAHVRGNRIARNTNNKMERNGKREKKDEKKSGLVHTIPTTSTVVKRILRIFNLSIYRLGPLPRQIES